MVDKRLYVFQLDESIQQSIIKQIRSRLQEEGFSEAEIDEAVENALCSKLEDIEYVLGGNF
ncbi:hypothetical protein ABE82_26090 (plasmid) [Paenibacillus peoriae]|uniref:hypothetical protein n=1 Tax=Paenibacillus peoriae TaxID=59893 RepID=UPI00072136C3|nr:hypothetical protein [Paenibacillus peoriae]ALS09892.1 hypothetical protein ABE82_26090 [Paenibacillus peoriae]